MNRRDAETHLLRIADYRARGKDHNEILRQVKRNEIVRIAPGVYAPQPLWSSSYPETKHALRVYAQNSRLRHPIFVLYSAAAVYEIALLAGWPDIVHVAERRDPKRGSRSRGQLFRHRAPLRDDEITTIDGITVTTVARTAYDLACELPFTDGVAMLDHIRRRGLASMDELTQSFIGGRKLPGRPRALKALEFSTDLSDSVQESRSRVLIYALGFPMPELQFTLNCDGRTYRADFWWKEYRHWAEFDGKGKYLSPEFQGGRSADKVVVAEKRREDAIRRHVNAFSRWEKSDLDDPRKLHQILTSNGLQSNGPRALPA